MKEWARRNLPTMIVLAITLLAVAVLAVEWCLIGGKTILALDAFDLIGEPEKKVEAYGKLLPALGLLAAAPVGVMGVLLAVWRTWNQHRDGTTAIRKLDAEAYAKAAEAFAKAVEQLGHDKSSIRMGAVLALEALGKSTPRLLSQAIEVLCGYVREARTISPTAPTDEAKNAPPPPLPTDIQLILDIVKRLKRGDINNRIRIDLSRTDLLVANLGEANLNEANLKGTILKGANLIKTSLSRVNLTEGDLSWTNLEKNDLSGANLTEVDLTGANLRKADLSEADLRWANLKSANLTGGNLSKANLTEANLRGATLIDTNLTDAIFENTTLPDGTVWTGKGPPPDPAPVTNA